MDLSLTTSTMAHREQLRIKEKCFHPTASFVEFEKEQVEQSIPQCFERIARTHPERLALKNGNLVYTYDSLNKAANSLAHLLLESSRASVAFPRNPKRAFRAARSSTRVRGAPALGRVLVQGDW